MACYSDRSEESLVVAGVADPGTGLNEAGYTMGVLYDLCDLSWLKHAAPLSEVATKDHRERKDFGHLTRLYRSDEFALRVWRNGDFRARFPIMTTQDIAERLVAHCRQGKWEAAQKELYAADAVSVEPEGNAAFEKETKGLNAIIEKGHKFDGMVEKVHSIEASDPLVNGNSIAFVLKLDLTMKGQGRMDMSELCVYHVKDGKVVHEEFHM